MMEILMDYYGGQAIGVSQLHTLNIDYRPAPTDVSAATAYATASRMYRQQSAHTPSIAFRHLFPNSARSGYATEGAPLISEQLSADAVSALRKVRVLIRPWKQHSAIVQELCESRGGRPGLSVLTSLLVSVDVKQH